VPTATLVRRTLLGVVAGAAATAAITGVRFVASDAQEATTTTVPTGVQVLQVEQYCRSRYPKLELLAAFPDTPSAKGWVCQYREGNDVVTKNLGQSDMDQQCRWQVGDESRAIALDDRDPHSWRCTDPSAARS
jgi:hypothetical protein